MWPSLSAESSNRTTRALSLLGWLLHLFDKEVSFIICCCETCTTPSCLRKGPSGNRDTSKWGNRRIIHNATLSPPERFCIQMGSGVSKVNVSLYMRGKDTSQCPKTTTLEEKAEPKRNRTGVCLLTRPAPDRWATPDQEV